MITIFTIAEFRNLKPGDTILVHLNNEYIDAHVEGYAFYNSDANEPGWEVETDCGFVSIYGAYKNIPCLPEENVQLISLERFKMLRPGEIIYFHRHGIYHPAVVTDRASKSMSLENSLDNGDDWEVGTNMGFIHNECAYIPIES